MIRDWSKVVPGASPEHRRSQSTSVNDGAAVEFVVLIQVFSWCLGRCRVLAAARVTGGGWRRALVVHQSPNHPEAPPLTANGWKSCCIALFQNSPLFRVLPKNLYG
ncbi:hypothetical protein Sjap_022768 [Stephania japonica]|uniref:Uncharacterized protein n=1 Tax=Stephania japonica TaxID=461633 RepID=A0AAP0EQ09_9MAGN